MNILPIQISCCSASNRITETVSQWNPKAMWTYLYMPCTPVFLRIHYNVKLLVSLPSLAKANSVPLLIAARYMMDDFSGLEGTSEVYRSFLSGSYWIYLPAIGYSAVLVPFFVELGQVLCFVTTRHGCKVNILPHPFVSVLGAAEAVCGGVSSFELCAALGAMDFHVAPPIPSLDFPLFCAWLRAVPS